MLPVGSSIVESFTLPAATRMPFPGPIGSTATCSTVTRLTTRLSSSDELTGRSEIDVELAAGPPSVRAWVSPALVPRTSLSVVCPIPAPTI
jgi:hypothetical protein